MPDDFTSLQTFRKYLMADVQRSIKSRQRGTLLVFSETDYFDPNALQELSIHNKGTAEVAQLVVEYLRREFADNQGNP